MLGFASGEFNFCALLCASIGLRRFFVIFERFCVLAFASGRFFLIRECFCVLALASGGIKKRPVVFFRQGRLVFVLGHCLRAVFEFPQN